MKQEKSYIFAFVKRKTNKMVNYLNTIFQIHPHTQTDIGYTKINP